MEMRSLHAACWAFNGNGKLTCCSFQIILERASNGNEKLTYCSFQRNLIILERLLREMGNLHADHVGKGLKWKWETYVLLVSNYIGKGF